MDDKNETQRVVEEISAASARPQLSPREIIGQHPTLASAVIQLVLAQMRPLLAFLYNGSVGARKLLQDSKEKWEPTTPDVKPGEAISGLITWLQKNGVNVVNHLPFQLLQDASANVYAAILLFECDKLVRQIKKMVEVTDGEAGPTFGGHPFTRILRAAGNQYRHGRDWPEVTPLAVEDARVLTDIGVSDVRADSAQAEVLAIIGAPGYFEFEDALVASITELLRAP